MPTVQGTPGSFDANPSAIVLFPVPPPPIDTGATFFHNQGTFHGSGTITANVTNLIGSTVTLDYFYVAIGYNTIIHNDDYIYAQIAVHATIGPHATQDVTIGFDADIVFGSEPFGKDPPRDLFCGPAAFYVGLRGGTLSWDSTPSTALNVHSIVAHFSHVEFNYDIVSGTQLCSIVGPCPRCFDPTDVPTGHPFGFTSICATEVEGVILPDGWSVTGPGLADDNCVVGLATNVSGALGFDVSGWSVNFSTCYILIQAPCDNFCKRLAGTSAGMFMAIITISGVTNIGFFNLIYTLRCTQIPPPPPGGPDSNPFNLQDHQGFYHMTGTKGPDIVYKRSDFGTSKGGFAINSGLNAPAGQRLHDPRVIRDNRQTVIMAYTGAQAVVDPCFKPTPPAHPSLKTDLLEYWIPASGFPTQSGSDLPFINGWAAQIDPTRGVNADMPFFSGTHDPMDLVVDCTVSDGLVIQAHDFGGGIGSSNGFANNIPGGWGSLGDFMCMVWVKEQAIGLFVGGSHDGFSFTNNSADFNGALFGDHLYAGPDFYPDPDTGLWHMLLCWYTVSDNTLHLSIDDTTEASVVLTDVPGAAVTNSVLIEGGIPGKYLSSFALWNGTIPDASGRTALWNGGVGHPYADWT